jgi:hypothetical protein
MSMLTHTRTAARTSTQNLTCQHPLIPPPTPHPNPPTHTQAQTFCPQFNYTAVLPLRLDAPTLAALATAEALVEVWHHCPRSQAVAAALSRGLSSSYAMTGQQQVLLGSGHLNLQALLTHPQVRAAQPRVAWPGVMHYRVAVLLTCVSGSHDQHWPLAVPSSRCRGRCSPPAPAGPAYLISARLQASYPTHQLHGRVPTDCTPFPLPFPPSLPSPRPPSSRPVPPPGCSGLGGADVTAGCGCRCGAPGGCLEPRGGYTTGRITHWPAATAQVRGTCTAS